MFIWIMTSHTGSEDKVHWKLNLQNFILETIHCYTW